MAGYRLWKPGRRKTLRCLLPIVAAIIVGACGSAPPVGDPTETPIQPTATVAIVPTPTQVQPTLVPTPTSAGSRATLTAEKDRVRFKLLNQAEQDLAIQAQQLIGKGDAINVDENGRAALDFLDAIRVDIFHDSQLSIKGNIDPNASALDLYALEGGTTLNQMDLDKIGANRVRLETTWAVIDDLGTEFIAYYDQTREATWIVVRKGVTEVRARNANGQPDQQMVQVNAGEQAWVLRQAQPVQPVPATRAAVGDLFPPLQALTDGEITDAAWLPTISRMTLDRTTLVSGQSTQGTLTLSGPAYGGGLEVALFSSDPALVLLPDTALVPTDAISQTFRVTAGSVSQTTDVVITASYQNDIRDITLRILPPPRPTATVTPARPTSTPTSVPPTATPTPSPPPALADLTLSPATVESGTPSAGIVTLRSSAPVGGVEISLISADETLAAIPPLVTVPVGATSARFDIKTAAVTQDTDVTILASDINGPPIRQTLTLLAPPSLASFAIEPSRVTAGDVAQGLVMLTRPAPAGGLSVSLASNSRLVRVPPSVTIAEGDDRAVFDIATPQVRQEIETEIQAGVGNVALTSLLTITPSLQPDLSITLGRPDVSCGGKLVVCYVTVSFTVSNLGAADVTQRFLVAIDADEVSPTTVVVDSLAAGQQVDLRARLGPGGNCYNPNCTVTVTVDPNNAIPELDETNNSASDTWNG